MTTPYTVLCGIKEAIKSSDRMPSATSYATFEVDTDGGQSDVRPPIIEIRPRGRVIESTPYNTHFSHYATDGNGNQIGYVFRTKFEMSYQIDVWTAEGDSYDPTEIGNEIRRLLGQYDTNRYASRNSVGHETTLPDPDDPSGTLDDVKHFVVSDGQPANNLTMTPALRRWRLTGEVWFNEILNTAEEYGPEEYVSSVRVPADGTLESGDTVEIVFDATATESSATDTYQ